jgi:hypothetical protein
MDRGDLLNNINGIGEMVVDSLCRSHACPLLASVEFRATQHVRRESLCESVI